MNRVGPRFNYEKKIIKASICGHKFETVTRYKTANKDYCPDCIAEKNRAHARRRWREKNPEVKRVRQG